MPGWLVGVAVVVGLYAAAVAALALAGRRGDAAALARFVPDCVVLLRRLAGDRRVSRARRVALWLGAAYVVVPFDLVPDVIPVVGQLDDAIVVVLLLRGVLRGAGEDVVREHWPGPERSLRLVLSVASGRRAHTA